MTNFYPQKSEDELLVLLSALQNRSTQGQVYMNGGVGTQVVRSFTGAARPEIEIRRVLYSLHLLNPSGYADPYAGRIRRTRASYTSFS